jgi:hypothetical protein
LKRDSEQEHANATTKLGFTRGIQMAARVIQPAAAGSASALADFLRGIQQDFASSGLGCHQSVHLERGAELPHVTPHVLGVAWRRLLGVLGLDPNRKLL